MRKIIALLLSLCILLSFAACDSNSDEKTDSPGNTNTGNGTAAGNGYLLDRDAEHELEKPAKALDPEAVYADLEYNYRMFYGSYRIPGGEEGELEYAKQMDYVPLSDDDEEDDYIAVLPYKFEAGKHSLPHVINGIKGKNFMRAYFYKANGYMDTWICAYTIEDDTITLNPVDTFLYNEEKNSIRYEMTDIFLTYTFHFDGRALTLSKDGKSVTMYSGLATTTDEIEIYVDNYLSVGSNMLDRFDKISLRWQEKEGSFYFEGKDYFDDGYCVALMEENGLFTITVPQESGVKTYQFVYFLCDEDGIILTDGENTYYYCDNYSDRYSSFLGDNLIVEDVQKLENMDADKLEQIVEKKADLLTDLAKAFKEAGLEVAINADTGEIALDSSVLFPVAGYQVSDEGKELLKKFVAVYTDVVFDEKYEGFISTIQIEGHTDSTGDYDDNTVLSENRAESVRTYCLSSECGVNAAYLALLEDSLVAVGYSCDKLIFDSKGNEDMAASRRVSFRFIINLEG